MNLFLMLSFSQKNYPLSPPVFLLYLRNINKMLKEGMTMEKIEATKTIIYATIDDQPLEGDFYKATGELKHKTILYYHGGGLIYGTRKDLPNQYLNQFLEAGYHVLAFDYPLTPESSFAQMISKVEESLQWFLEKGEEMLPIKTTDYILFGRSAGAYLANYLIKTSILKNPHN